MNLKRITIILLATIILLSIPFVATKFTDEVTWDLLDFVVAGSLLIGAGLGYELISTKVKSRAHRIAAGITIIILLILIWMHLAVGIFGN